MVERNTGKTILSVEKNLSHKLILSKLEKHCIKPVKVFTDDYKIYSKLENHHIVLKHETINHSLRNYADGENHVNNAENRHSLLRPFLNMFRGVSKKNLNTYVKFFQFTFNNGVKWFNVALKTILDHRTTLRR